jgi:DNA-binding LacI/PurR family transcriptional regulator
MAPARVTKNGIPVAELLLAKLRRQLAARNLQPGEFALSESDLARSEGVNRRFVRQAVDVLIREGRLERRPGKGVFGREAASTPRLVQVVVPHLRSHLCAEMTRGVKEVGIRAGVRVQIHDAHGSYESDLVALRSLPECAAEGTICLSLHVKRFAEILSELRAARYPFVLVDETLRDIDVPCVVADNYGGGYTAGREMIKRGHKRIGFVGYMGADTVRARLEGLRDAMADARLILDRSFIKELFAEKPEDWPAEADRLTRELLSRSDRPTAIFFFNDLAAASGHRAINTMGLRIPEDVSVVGFDGDSFGRLLTPTLATVRQPARQMGGAAMEMLLALMAGSRKHEGAPMATKLQDGHGDAQTQGQGDGPGPPEMRRHGDEGGGGRAEGGRNGQEVLVAGRRIASMETDAPKFSRPRRPAANTTRDQDAWRRVLPVTWQDGDSLGPAPDTRAERHGDADIGGRGDAVQAPQLAGV